MIYFRKGAPALLLDDTSTGDFSKWRRGAPFLRLPLLGGMIVLTEAMAIHVIPQNVGPVVGPQIVLDPLPLVVIFNDVVLAASWGLSADVTPYGVTANTVTFLRGRTLNPTTTTYTVTFNAVTLNAPGHLNINKTTYAVTFRDVVLLAICHAHS